MRFRSSLVLVLAFAPSLVLAGELRAQEVFRARARAERPIAARAELDPTAAGTRVEIESASQRSARDLVGEVPGTRVLGSGGVGQFTGVSLRGGDLAHTAIFLGTLPLSGPDGVLFDLGSLDLRAFGAIEVYRGGAPLVLGENPIGGAIRLLPRVDEGAESGVLASYGSFDTARARLWASVRRGRLQSYATVSVEGSDNDYPYFSDGGTSFASSDDGERRLKNAGALRGTGILNLRIPLGEHDEVETLILWSTLDGGVGGPASNRALRAHQNIERYAGSLAYRARGEVGSDRVGLELMVGGSLLRTRFADAFSEFGIERDTDDWQRRALGRIVASWSPSSALEIDAIVTAKHDTYEPDDAYRRVPLGGSERVGASGGLEATLTARVDQVRIVVRPSLRYEWSQAQLEQESLGMHVERSSSTALPTARVGWAVSPLDGLTISGSAARGYRLPSMLELFGRPPSLSPNIDLKPERAILLDAGIVWTDRVGEVDLEGELRGFGSWVDDMIRYRRTQSRAIAENIERARIFGLELAGRARLGAHVRTELSLSALDARDEHGRTLPFRASWRVQTRLEALSAELLELMQLSGYTSCSYTSPTPVDPQNLIVIRDLFWLDLGMRAAFWSERFGVSFVVRDIFDFRGQDFLGYPLPGRRFDVQLDLQGEF